MDAAKLNEALKPFAALMDAEQNWRQSTQNELHSLRSRFDTESAKKESAENMVAFCFIWALVSTIAFVGMAVYHFAAK